MLKKRINKAYISFLALAIFILLFSSFASSLDSSAYGEPIKKSTYEISRSKIDRTIKVGELVKDSIVIKNLGNKNLSVSLFVSKDISDIVELNEVGGISEAGKNLELTFTLFGKQEGNFSGKLSIASDITEEIPINLTVISANKSDNTILIDIFETNKKILNLNTKINVFLSVKKLDSSNSENITLNISYYLKNQKTNETYLLGLENKTLMTDVQSRKIFALPENLTEGFYTISVELNASEKNLFSNVEIRLKKSFLQTKLLGIIPIWLLIAIIVFLSLAYTTYEIIKKRIERNKKYKMDLHLETLPKKDERAMWLGKIAEKTIPAYFDLDALTTHAVVAGATGGGKSIAAQALIEEALIKNASVIVFDPTAQWSGMLRKCDDKKMLSFYAKFGMKDSDARAFPGNVRQIVSENQYVDIKKYMNPGHIQIFTMNKLTPPQIDTFCANVIASIFKSDPQEYPQLKTLIVFDEVHRLLPKFGGSGKGFLQIERACREFRKWGFGVMLVSQVLSDFVGEIKANINTEVQMRTRDEADLNRIKTKYGEEFLQSLIKASVGVGMFVNPKYNKGKPYFINFRPILHNTRRLSDAILEQYNKYSEIIDDIEYQIEQLEVEKVDIFDVKMELKLVKDKLMTGNFTVVDIYLEELKPRIEKQWQTLGKKPKKLQIQMVDEKALATSIKAAEKDRGKWKDEENKDKKGK